MPRMILAAALAFLLSACPHTPDGGDRPGGGRERQPWPYPGESDQPGGSDKWKDDGINRW